MPWDFPGGSDGKQSACNAGGVGLIPGLGRSPGEGKGYPLQYSGLEKSMDCIVYAKSIRVAKDCKESDMTECFLFYNDYFLIFLFEKYLFDCIRSQLRHAAGHYIMWDLLLQHMDFLVEACGLSFSKACGILVP